MKVLSDFCYDLNWWILFLIDHLYTKMEYHTGQRYSDAVGYIRKRLRFEILRTTVISLRGDRGARKNIVDINSLDLNLEPQGQG